MQEVLVYVGLVVPWLVALFAALGWLRERRRDTKAEVRSAVNEIIGENMLQLVTLGDRTRDAIAAAREAENQSQEAIEGARRTLHDIEEVKVAAEREKSDTFERLEQLETDLRERMEQQEAAFRAALEEHSARMAGIASAEIEDWWNRPRLGLNIIPPG